MKIHVCQIHLGQNGTHGLSVLNHAEGVKNKEPELAKYQVVVHQGTKVSCKNHVLDLRRWFCFAIWKNVLLKRNGHLGDLGVNVVKIVEEETEQGREIARSSPVGLVNHKHVLEKEDKKAFVMKTSLASNGPIGDHGVRAQ